MPFDPPFLESIRRLELNQIEMLLGVGLRPLHMSAERAADWLTERRRWPRPSEMLWLDADAGLPLRPKERVS